MSSLWATMKKRRGSGSSNTNLTSAETAGGRTPSGRSSASRDSRDDHGSRTGTGDSRDDAFTTKVSRLAEQVLPRSGFRSLRLPPSLTKGFGTASLPRHFTTRSVDSEMPANSSQGREEGESKSPRGPLMGLSTDRFPGPIKNLLQRPRRDKPPLPPEKIPLKPSRRPGPVGKSWVKVYDDIIYMDDPSAEEMVPIPGYTGYPTVVPDAEPLPMAPTPPPERMKPSLVEKVPRRKRELERGSAPYEDKENISPNVTGAPKPPPSTTRPGRSREISRYRGKRQKRSGTPIGRNLPSATIDGEEDEVPLPGEDDNEEVMEDGYIIPQSLKPPKPPRGNKIYETLNKTVEPKRNEEALGEEVPSPQVGAEPQKPKRGMKIYESIIITVKDERKTSSEDDVKLLATTETPSALNRSLETEGKGAELPPKPKRGIKIYETIEIGFRVDPTKGNKSPKLAKKVEEDKHEEGKSEGKTDEAIGETSPPKPSRGNKIYATVTKIPISTESAPPFQGPMEPHSGDSGKVSDDSKLENETEASSKQEDAPLYAKVHKSSRSKDSTEESEASSPLKEERDPSFPPPVPPKKRKLLLKQSQPVVENVYDLLPFRPPRRLKLRPRSCDASPSRPKRQRTLMPFQENGFPPHKPPRGWKMKSEDNVNSAVEKERASTFPLPRSKRRITESSSFENKSDEEGAFPPKALRNSQSRLLPAPPRRKKLDRSFEEDQVPLPKQEDQIPIPKPDDQILIPKTEDQISIPKIHDSTLHERGPLGKTLTADAAKGVTPSIPSLPLKTDEDMAPPPPPPKRGKLTGTGTDRPQESLPQNLNMKENEIERERRESESVEETEHSPRLDTDDVGCISSDFISKLDTDIESNLKKIEISFETLDTVIQCLKKYASQGSLSEADKIVCSSDSVCDKDVKPADVEHRCKHEPTNEVGNATDTAKTQDLRSKEGTSGVVSLDSEFSDLSIGNSDAETVIFVGKSSSDDSLNLVDNILNFSDLAEDKKDISDSAAIPPSLLLDQDRENLVEDEETEPKPLEISFVIKSDQPVTLPKPEHLQTTKPDNKQKDSNEHLVTSEIPLKLKTAEKSEFKFEPSVTECEAKPTPITSTEVPIKLTTTEKSEFKFESSVEESKPEFKPKAQPTPITSTEVPIKLTTTEKSEFKFESSVEESKPEFKPKAEPKRRQTFPSFESLSPTQLLPFSPRLLEALATITRSQKLLLEQGSKPPISENTEYQSNFKPILVHDLPPTDLLYFRPSLLRSEKQETDFWDSTLPLPSEPFIPKLDHKSKSKPEVAPPPSIQSASASFDSLSPTHLTPFSPKLLEGRKELTDNQKHYRLEETPDLTTPLNLQYLDYIKSIPFYDLTPTDILPFSPTSLVSEEELGDILTPKASTPESEALPIPLVSQSGSDHAGTSELANRLEGIHSQLEAIITNYPTSTSSSYSSLDTALSDVSNSSSLCLDFPPGTSDSPLSFSSFYSPTAELCQQSYSSCSTPQTFYTATTPSEKSFLTDSGTNTPGSSSNSSLKADDDLEYEVEEDNDECIPTAPVQEEDQQRQF